MNFLKIFLLALLSAVFYALAFPPLNISPLIFISFLPMLFILEKEKSIFKYALAGYIFGFLSNTFILYWIVYTLSTFGEMSVFMSVITFILLNLYLSIYPALFFLIYFLEKSSKTLIPSSVLASLSFVGLEFIRGNFLTGFPWADAGYALFSLKYLPQSTDIFGHYFLSFLIIFTNLSLFKIIIDLRVKNTLSALKQIGVIFVIFLLCYIYGYGKFHINNKQYPMKTFGIVQGNINQAIKWNPEYRKSTVEKYEKITLSLIQKNPEIDIVIWPETSTPFFFRHNLLWSKIVKKIVKKAGKPLFFGTPDYRIIKGKIRYLNTALLLDKTGSKIGEYNKLHLVPFGEYIPLYDYLKFIEKLFPMAGIFSSGEEVKLISSGKVRIAPLICYEAIFPEIARVMVRKGANVIFNITNDAWFGKTSAPYQHFNLTRARAIEMKIPLVRSANTGISGAINEKGEVIFKTNIFVDASGTAKLRLKEKNSLTFYAKYGDLFAVLSIILPVIIIIKEREII